MQLAKSATIAAIVLAIGLSTKLASAEYRVVDLGSIDQTEGDPAGSLYDYSSGGIGGGSLNNNGQAVGYSYNEFGARQAFLYSNGVMTDLGTAVVPDSPTYESWATAINNNGLVAGYTPYNGSSSPSIVNAATYQNGSWTVLGALNNSTRFSYAFGINDSGQVVGQSSITNSTTNRPYHAFIYTNGVMKDIGTAIAANIPGTGIGTYSYAFQINNSGVAVGYYTDASNNDHVFTYNANTGIATEIGVAAPLGGNQADGKIINNAGQIAGNYYNPTLSQLSGFLYSNGTWTSIPMLTDPTSINDSGDIVGDDNNQSLYPHEIMLYHNGQISDLNTLISLDPDWHISGASSINDNGQILADATYSNNGVSYSHAVILNPLLPGDADGDGHVSLSDLAIVLNNFGQATSSWGSGNFDGASTIDLTDLGDVLNNFGQTSVGFSSTPAADPSITTPEPASAAILALGGLFILRRRNRTNSSRTSC